MTAEHKRFAEVQVCSVAWRRWGPYPSERQWGTVREDVKNITSTWTKCPVTYMKALYKYPQQAYPYVLLVAENSRRGRHEPEYERLDTEPQLVAF